MIEYIKRSIKGQENFWRVFWPWVFGVNGVWLSIFIDRNFTKFGLGRYIVDNIDNYVNGLPAAMVYFMFLIYTPFSLYLGSKSDGKGPWGRFIIVILWVLFVVGVIWLIIIHVFACLLVSSNLNEKACVIF